MTTTDRKSGLFRSALDAFMEARQHQANRYVSGVLLSLDDETLNRHGYSRAELSKNSTTRFYL